MHSIAIFYFWWFSEIQEMEKEVEDRRIELDIAQRRRERESETKKRNHKKSTANCRQFLFRKSSQLLPFWTFYWTFPPCLCPFKSSPRNLFLTCSNFIQFRFSAHLRTLVYESSSLWCESWELSDALCDLSVWGAAACWWRLGSWAIGKVQSGSTKSSRNSWHMVAWRYPTGSPTGKPDDEAALDEVGSLNNSSQIKMMY